MIGKIWWREKEDKKSRSYSRLKVAVYISVLQEVHSCIPKNSHVQDMS